MQTLQNRDKILTVKDGWLSCPICKRNHKVKRIGPDEEGRNIVCFCRSCKNEITVDIQAGQCYMSQSR